MIPLFTTNLLDGKTVPLYGDGGNVRDWIHVHDHNTAADLVLRSGDVGEIYNIGAGNEITNSELTHRLLELTGRDESFITPVDRSPRPRSPVLDHPRQGQCARLEDRAQPGRRRWRPRSSGTATTVAGGNR